MTRAAVLTLLIAAGTTLAPAAHAASSVRVACTDGDFGGELKLSYETAAGAHRLVGAKAGAGPYIGDSAGSINLKVRYERNGADHSAVDRTRSGLRSDEVVEFPVNGTTVPSATRTWVEVRFSDSSGERCTARKTLS